MKISTFLAPVPLFSLVRTAISRFSLSPISIFLFFAVGVSALSPQRAQAAFGLTNSGGYYTVDSGAGLVFKVNQANGDISSLKLNGTELNSQVKRSHIGSGLGASTVTATTYGTNTIKITVSTATLTHYYMVRNAQNTIYMATFISQQPTVGELRWITRLQTAVVPNSPTPSDLRGTFGAIESQDVFGMNNGQTRSKYYGNERAMDLAVRGVTGNGIGVWMHYGNRESASGGPFFRDIQNQSGAETEVYNYMNSGHNQTEPFRTGVLHGPYALIFTNGSTPDSALDYGWIHSQGLNLTGWVQHRGYVIGKATGIPSGFQGVVGFANATAQGWCVIDPATGNFSSPWLKPGDYNMTLYKGELAVASQPVTIPQSTVPVTKNIASAEFVPASSLWRIGEWDGTPAGFLNASNIVWMHPSDSRQSAWGPTTFTVGSSAWNTFPSAQWKDVNNSTAIQFPLASNQIAPLTLRIGISAAYAGGRPQIKVNNWSSSIPSPSSQPDSRSLTIGTYRGNNITYTYTIPASALVSGTNTLNLIVVSGSGAAAFLSAGYAYDCVELEGPAPLSGAFRITPQHAQDKALAVLDSNPNNGAQTVISSYGNGAGQQFLLDSQSDGSYRIRTQLTGNRCVELPFGDASDGKLIKLWDANGNSAQRWNVVPVSGEWFKIVPKNDATKAMDVSGGPSATADGTFVQSWTFLGGSNQLWKLTAVTPTPPNAAPVAQNDAYNGNEDSPITADAANGLLVNDTDAEGNALTLVDSDAATAGIQAFIGPAHGVLVLNADGSFSYTPETDFNGLDSFSYKISDGTLLGETAVVNLTVNSVNDPPSFSGGANQTVANTAGAQSISNWATALSVGPSDEAGQILDFIVSNSNPTLFATQPAISAAGVLTFTPSANASGNATVTLRLHDNGGIAHNGIDTSAAQTFTLAVTASGPAPTVASFSPTSGAVGTVVTIKGTGFSNSSVVKFNAVAAASVTFVSATQIKATVPATATTGKLSVSSAGATVISSATFKVSPKLSGFNPGGGSFGTPVTLTGTGLLGATAVKFNGKTTTFSVVSSTQITTVVPANATTGKISVSSAGGTATSTSSFLVSTPFVSSFSPSSGPVGTILTVSGGNFSNPTAVQFNGFFATNVTWVSATKLSVTVPSGATTGPVRVTAANGESGVSTGIYKVTPLLNSFSPGNGATGTIVTLTGSGLTDTTTVKFNGTIAAFSVVDSQTLTATVPTSATTGKISVSNKGGSVTGAAFFLVAPRISGFSPTSAVAGAIVTISGANFLSPTGAPTTASAGEVRFNGMSAGPRVSDILTASSGFQIVSSTQIKVRVPAAAGTGKISVSNGVGDTGISTNNFSGPPSALGS